MEHGCIPGIEIIIQLPEKPAILQQGMGKRGNVLNEAY